MCSVSVIPLSGPLSLGFPWQASVLTSGKVAMNLSLISAPFDNQSIASNCQYLQTGYFGPSGFKRLSRHVWDISGFAHNIFLHTTRPCMIRYKIKEQDKTQQDMALQDTAWHDKSQRRIMSRQDSFVNYDMRIFFLSLHSQSPKVPREINK